MWWIKGGLFTKFLLFSESVFYGLKRKGGDSCGISEKMRPRRRTRSVGEGSSLTPRKASALQRKSKWKLPYYTLSLNYHSNIKPHPSQLEKDEVDFIAKYPRFPLIHMFSYFLTLAVLKIIAGSYYSYRFSQHE